MELLNENGKFYLKGLATECCRENGNGRVYPKDILEKAINELQSKIEMNSVLCELEHPNYYEINENGNICGKIINLDWIKDEGKAYCKVEIFEDTLHGMKIITDYKSGLSYGISSRGRGTLNENKICTSLEISTFDIVAIPSCKDCILTESENTFLTDILFESKDILCGCKLDEKSKSIAASYLEESIIKLFR